MITAIITGRGPESQCPDTPGAVDADIFRDGRRWGAVTLVPPADSRRGPVVDTWGGIEHWASAEICDALCAMDHEDRADVICEIVAAVQAAEGQEP